MTQQQLQTRLQAAEAETARLRHVNEALMLGTAEQRHAAAASAVAAFGDSGNVFFPSMTFHLLLISTLILRWWIDCLHS